MKLDINKLNEAVEKAFDKIFEEEDRKEVKNTKPTQWHDDYSNKEEKNVVQTRINPDTKKPEFKIPTNDKVYDTRDAAIAALKESKKKTITITESDIRNMVMEALNELDYSTYKSAFDKMVGKGQHNRADRLNQGVNQVYGQHGNRDAAPDDPSQDEIRFNLVNDTMNMASPIAGKSTYFTRDGELKFNNPKFMSNANDTNSLRTSHRKVANNRAKALDWYRGCGEEGHRTVDDFIAETVTRVLSEALDEIYATNVTS